MVADYSKNLTMIHNYMDGCDDSIIMSWKHLKSDCVRLLNRGLRVKVANDESSDDSSESSDSD